MGGQSVCYRPGQVWGLGWIPPVEQLELLLDSRPKLRELNVRVGRVGIIHGRPIIAGRTPEKGLSVLPIRDLNPSRTTSFITWLLIGACVAVFFLVRSDEAFFFEAASIPCEVTTGEPLAEEEIRTGACNRGDGPPVFPAKNIWLSVGFSLFLHGSLLHLISNMWVLAIFGNNVEDAFGHFPYLLFYVLAGLAASITHFVLNPESTIPVVGASGAIAGLMGAYAVLFPRARVTAVIPPFFFWPLVLPAMLFLLIWFGSQFLLAGEETLIAWEAHVAGFLFGFIAALVLRKRLRQHSTVTPTYYHVGRYRS